MTKVRRATVIGTGLMAPGIAAALSQGKIEVTIAGRHAAASRLAAQAVAPKLSGGHAAVAATIIGPEAFQGADLVIETIVEDFAEKHDLLRRIDPWLARDTIVTSNTSSLPLDKLAQALSRPDRFAGFHFLNPAEVTTVVEVISASETAASVLAALRRVASRMGKRVVDVRLPIPGFVWNRIQFAVLRECAHLLAEGVTDVESIDAAVAEGLAVRWVAAGPLATADLGGAKTFGMIARQLFPILASGGDVLGPLGSGLDHYEWDEKSRAAVEGLRAETLEWAGDVSDKRRAIHPEARDASGATSRDAASHDDLTSPGPK